ncbi:hypothetical protein ABBQ32_001704 [Trebouxia sp. C0010 RCD-2024]
MQGDQHPVLLYHEKQVASLCGVHCLNALLQGPTFSEMDLGQIALELDQQERAFMAEGGMESEDYLKYIAEDSGNVAADGNFSVQVLAKALEVWNLSLQPLDAPDMRISAQHPEQEDAFICNLQEHWFTIRRVYGDFWNFNSLFPAPQPLSQFYLSAFLATLREQGYTIFVVKGPLSQQQNEDAGQPDSHGAWFTPEQAKAANVQASDVRQQGYLMAALQGALDKAKPGGNLISLKRRGSGGGVGRGPAAAGDWEQWPEEAAAGSPAGGQGNEDDDMQRAIAASLADPDQGAASTPATSQPSAPAQSASASTAQQIQATGPAAVAAVRAMQATTMVTPPSTSKTATSSAAGTLAQTDSGPVQALEEEPSAGEGVLELAFRLPNNKRLQRRFRRSDTVSKVAAFLGQSSIDMQQHVIIRSFPRKSLTSMEETLLDAGLGDKEMLVVDMQR